MTRAEYLVEQANKRILILDGAMGTEIQKLPLSAEDVSFGDIKEAYGCNELLNLTKGEVIFDIHLSYLRAGADIVETNTFGANAFSLAEYGLSDHVYDINLAAVEIARAAIEVVEDEDPLRYAFIAGVIGPTGKSASFSPSVDDPSFREIDFDGFVHMYMQQIEALVDGKVDLLLIETVFDTLVAKAAIVAALQVMDAKHTSIPIMVSATFSDKSARTLSGQTLEAFVDTLSSYPLFSLGVNCSTGPEEMIPLLRKLSSISPFRTSAHPNAGFPDNEGNYGLSPEDMARLMRPELDGQRLNIIGGCCGTTEHHIAALAEVARNARIRTMPVLPKRLRACGLEPLRAVDPSRFIAVGERTNVAGSRRFARLIRERKFSQALAIAKGQIEQGAAVIDICMDDPLLDPVESMVTFLRLAAAEPEIARVPFMIDSSNWEVVVAGLKEVQGRAIVNSISLKEGEEQFLERARHISRMGADLVVMLFDESGQADTFEKRCAIASRAYSLLVDSGICLPQSIIFDPNVLAIATGIEGHDRYASDFIRAVGWIRSHYPLVSISGGISNLSFSFRGNNSLREAIHAIFLDYAIDSGLNMAIVNPGSLIDPNTIPPRAAQIISDAILADGDDSVEARDALISLAMTSLEWGETPQKEVGRSLREWRTLPLAERLAHALLIGEEAFMEADLDEGSDLDAVSIIEGPLMDGMVNVGTLFGEGKLFLPQVVRSARVMKRAVDILQPRLQARQGAAGRSSGTIVLATVKGDVHDIGKNIVSLVLQCNNFRVIDLGVMVPAQTILDAAIEHQATIVGLSGLITPSLSEMAQVCRLFQEAGSQVPIMIGGATTSVAHTALKLAPMYPSRVFHSTDASDAVNVARKIASVHASEYAREVEKRYMEIRMMRSSAQSKAVLSLEQAQQRKFMKARPAPIPQEGFGVWTVDDVTLEQLVGSINWAMVASGWKVPARSEEALTLKADAERLLGTDEVKHLFKHALRARVGIFPALAKGDRSIEIINDGQSHMLDFLRMQLPARDGLCRSLADYIHPSEQDTIGMFVATAGIGVDTMVSSFRQKGDDYHALLLSMLADRLAEAFSGYLEKRLATSWWKTGDAHVIRPAVGYPSAPDHMQKSLVFSLLEATETIGVELTEGFGMRPAASVCGFYFVGEGCEYFSLGPIGEDQLAEYVERGGRTREMVERTMSVETTSAIKEAT